MPRLRTGREAVYAEVIVIDLVRSCAFTCCRLQRALSSSRGCYIIPKRTSAMLGIGLNSERTEVVNVML